MCRQDGEAIMAREKKRTLGEFEHQVLLCILRHGSESYSMEIVLELESRTGKEVATAAVFVAGVECSWT